MVYNVSTIPVIRKGCSGHSDGGQKVCWTALPQRARLCQPSTVRNTFRLHFIII